MYKNELSIFPKNIEQLLIGFDTLTSDLSFAGFGRGATQGFPPYNVIKTNDNQYSIELAVAGFKPEEISITTENGFLTIESVKNESLNKDETNYIHRGLAKREFTRTFKIYEHVNITTAEYSNGILTINLERKIPEHLKPQSIKILTK